MDECPAKGAGHEEIIIISYKNYANSIRRIQQTVTGMQTTKANKDLTTLLSRSTAIPRLLRVQLNIRKTEFVNKQTQESRRNGALPPRFLCA